MVTVSDYRRITNCSGDFNLWSFSFDEVTAFLKGLGYEVRVIKGLYRTQIRESEAGTGSCRNVGDPINMEREFVVAVLPDMDIPLDLNDVLESITLSAVFQAELKHKLLH